MKKTSKQISYPDLFKRIITSIMDILVISIIFAPFTSWINRKIFLDKYGDLLAQNDVDLRDAQAMVEFFSSPEIADQMTYYNAFQVTFPMLIVQMITMGIYFIGSWYYIGTTPMKYILSMKIVDANTLEKPKLINLIWRFLGYGFFVFGLWFAIFTKKKQALHDKMANTIVIKS